jgi:hypothetical protein
LATSEATKPCPKCNFLWGKVDGCYQMMCLTCKTLFCWECAHEWDSRHTSHFDCPYPKREFTVVDFSKLTSVDPKAPKPGAEPAVVTRINFYKKQIASIRAFVTKDRRDAASTAARFTAAAARCNVDAKLLRRLFEMLLEGFSLLMHTRVHVHVQSERKYASFVRNLNPVFITLPVRHRFCSLAHLSLALALRLCC